VIEPGRTIGILGGGQLGRMFAIAARRMGYRVHAFDPTPDCPTGQVADDETNAPYDDLDAAERFARGVDVVTFEFENVPSQTLTAIETLRPVHPSPFVLDTTRHRLREKTFLADHGFPVAPFRAVRGIEDLKNAISDLGTPCVLKTAEFGYDGKGQSRIDAPAQAAAAWAALNCPLGVLEKFVRFDSEISVVGARGAGGAFHCYPPLVNVHRHHILDLTTTWDEADDSLAHRRVRERALALANDVAQKLDVVGTMCVEMFVIGDDVVVNEIAPRPHNSGHLTIDAAVTCQFEQQVRAVCGLPMGDASMLAPAAAMANLLGDLWPATGEPAWHRALADPRVKLHLYGKTVASKGRKMGHLTATAATPAEARDRVVAARIALTPSGPSPAGEEPDMGGSLR
jgi:5-(carboxyamino)imidazole ribonucleotide synthase